MEILEHSLIFAIFTFGLGLVLHLLAARSIKPKKQISFLIFTFFLISFFSQFIFIFNTKNLFRELNDYAIFLTSFWLFIISSTLAFACFFSAIDVDSPTLQILNLIKHHGQNGITLTDIKNAIKENDFLSSRLDRMYEGGQIYDSDQYLYATYKGLLLVKVLGIYGSIVGIKSGDG